MFRTPLCPSSGAREYYTSGCCMSYFVLGFQVVGMVWSWGLCVWFAGFCLLNMFRAPICPSSEFREYYISGCCMSYLGLGFQVVGMVWSWGLCVRFAGCIHTHTHTHTHTYIYMYILVKVKVKQSRNRPGVAQRVPGGLGSQIFMTFGTWRWWDSHPHAPANFTPRNVPGIHFR